MGNDVIDDKYEQMIYENAVTNPTEENINNLDRIADNPEEEKEVDTLQKQLLEKGISTANDIVKGGLSANIGQSLWDNIVRGI